MQMCYTEPWHNFSVSERFQMLTVIVYRSWNCPASQMENFGGSRTSHDPRPKCILKVILMPRFLLWD